MLPQKGSCTENSLLLTKVLVFTAQEWTVYILPYSLAGLTPFCHIFLLTQVLLTSYLLSYLLFTKNPSAHVTLYLVTKLLFTSSNTTRFPSLVLLPDFHITGSLSLFRSHIKYHLLKGLLWPHQVGLKLCSIIALFTSFTATSQFVIII